MAVDYKTYVLSPAETAVCALAGAAAAGAGAQILFGHAAVSLVSAVAAVPAAIAAGRNILKKRSLRKLLMQFRDMLDAMKASVSSGRNLYGAVSDCIRDTESLHGKNGMIVSELKQISDGMRNGADPGDLFRDLAERSGLEDVADFAGILGVTAKTGGDIRRTVSECRDVICAKIRTEAAIRATVASNKNELYVMSLMPFAVSAVLKAGGTPAADGASGLAFRVAAVAIYLSAFAVGMKITDVKV